jgi:hypothetical protein
MKAIIKQWDVVAWTDGVQGPAIQFCKHSDKLSASTQGNVFLQQYNKHWRLKKVLHHKLATLKVLNM